MEDLRALSKLQSQIAGITLAGLKKSVAGTDELRSTCGQLLINALNTFAAAVQTLRAGYLLAPGVLCRNVVETLAVIAHLIENPKDLVAFRAGKFSSSKAVTAANRMIPVFGELYGNLSSQFAHIGALHHSIQPLKPFQTLNEPLRLNLSILRVSLWVAYATAELLFFDTVAKPRYWKNLGKGAFMYDPSETERAWQKAFLQDALAD